MTTFIFYTDEGYTIAPNNENIDNLQVLGFEEGETIEEALVKLYENNEWIKEKGFTKWRIRCKALLNE